MCMDGRSVCFIERYLRKASKIFTDKRIGPEWAEVWGSAVSHANLLQVILKLQTSQRRGIRKKGRKKANQPKKQTTKNPNKTKSKPATVVLVLWICRFRHFYTSSATALSLPGKRKATQTKKTIVTKILMHFLALQRSWKTNYFYY